MSTIRLLSPLIVAGAVIIMRIIRRRRSALLVNGVTLPFEIVGPSSGRVCVVVGHGLGSSDPSAKSHADDASRPVLVPAVEAAGVRAVWYTARGHGASTGWEGGDPAQFSWPALASDMLSVAAATCGPARFVASGNSMGAATALSAALAVLAKHPHADTTPAEAIAIQPRFRSRTEPLTDCDQCGQGFGRDPW